MAEKEGARKTGKAYVVCATPDICLTGGCPVPYSIMSYLDCAEDVVESVRMTSQRALNMDSYLSTVLGDEAGTGGGVASGVNLGYCVPITYCPTVRAKGNNVLFHSSELWMNCPAPEGTGNTKGKLTYVEIVQPISLDSSGDMVGVTNPPIIPESPEELQCLQDAPREIQILGALDLPVNDLAGSGTPPTKPTKSTDSSDQRTSARDEISPYSDYGVTSSGDAVFASGALLKGRDPKTGIEVDLLSASMQVGLETELQARLVSVGGSSDDGTKSGGMDIVSARAAVGIHNPDGSTGLNVSLSGNIIGVQISGTHDGEGGALGVGAGVGAEGFVGFGDSDSDGRPEFSARFSGKVLGAFTIGRTWEFPFQVFTPKK